MLKRNLVCLECQERDTDEVQSLSIERPFCKCGAQFTVDTVTDERGRTRPPEIEDFDYMREAQAWPRPAMDHEKEIAKRPEHLRASASTPGRIPEGCICKWNTSHPFNPECPVHGPTAEPVGNTPAFAERGELRITPFDHEDDEARDEQK